MLGKTEGRRKRGQQRMRWLITSSIDMRLSKLREMVKDREIWHAAAYGVRVGHNLETEQQQGKETNDRVTNHGGPLYSTVSRVCLRCKLLDIINS